MNKVRIQSPLDRLPLHVKQQLAAWLTTGGRDGVGLTYAETRQRLLVEFGVSTSCAALCNYFQRHAKPAPNHVPGDASVARLFTLPPDFGARIVMTVRPEAGRPIVHVTEARNEAAHTIEISIQLPNNPTPAP